MLICPLCKQNLIKGKNTYLCGNAHSFDIAKEGYVNLLAGRHKPGSLVGDNREMAKARRAFLESGGYDFLADALAEKINAAAKQDAVVLDISCGEGYYTAYLKKNTNAVVYGFDISKEMIRPAAKKYRDILFFVANVSKIPVQSQSVDIAVQICAPFHEAEFSRILKPDGVLYSVVPARRHLWGLKEVLYETPYENEEACAEYVALQLVERETVIQQAQLTDPGQIRNLFAMTPYFYKTSDKDKQKLSALASLSTEFSFDIRTFQKRSSS